MELEEKAVELVDKISSAIESAAQPATELALRAVQLNAIVNLSLCVLVGLAAWGIALFVHRRIQKDDWDSEMYIPAFVCVALGIVVQIIGLAENLVSAIDPAAGLALKVIEAIG